MHTPLDETLKLFFPQWQGSGMRGLCRGAHLLYEAFKEEASFSQVPIASTYSLTVSENILGYSQILTQLSEACRIIETHDPARILTIGGDCGVEIAPIPRFHGLEG
ncbi:MAG: hypothetical protein WA885_19410 [Phormidesmis sp.]